VGADCEPAEGAAEAALAALSRAWALGPRAAGPNVLLRSWAIMGCADGGPPRAARLAPPHAARALGLVAAAGEGEGEGEGAEGEEAGHPLLAQLAAAVHNGFQLGAERGPLCDEPAWGVAWELLLELRPPAAGEEAEAGLAGCVLDAARKAVRWALEAAAPRLAEQHYLCCVATSAEALGGTYAVLHRRRGRVLSEEMNEGTGAFAIRAHLPTAAAFGLAAELRAHSAGAAAAQLLLSHWGRRAEDPRFVATTEEELEEWGAGGGPTAAAAGGAPSSARATVDAVRRRKGLPVEEKVVACATKQRTQARKK